MEIEIERINSDICNVIVKDNYGYEQISSGHIDKKEQKETALMFIYVAQELLEEC